MNCVNVFEREDSAQSTRTARTQCQNQHVRLTVFDIWTNERAQTHTHTSALSSVVWCELVSTHMRKLHMFDVRRFATCQTYRPLPHCVPFGEPVEYNHSSWSVHVFSWYKIYCVRIRYLIQFTVIVIDVNARNICVGSWLLAFKGNFDFRLWTGKEIAKQCQFTSFAALFRCAI